MRESRFWRIVMTTGLGRSAVITFHKLDDNPDEESNKLPYATASYEPVDFKFAIALVNAPDGEFTIEFPSWWLRGKEPQSREAFGL